MQVTGNVHLEIASLRKARLRVRCFGLRVWGYNVGEVLTLNPSSNIHKNNNTSTYRSDIRSKNVNGDSNSKNYSHES